MKVFIKRALLCLAMMIIISLPLSVQAAGAGVAGIGAAAGSGAAGSTTNQNGNYSGDINDFGFTISEDGVSYTGDLATNKTNNSESAWNNFFDKYKGFILGIAGIGTLTMILLFIMNFMKLGTTAGNPQERQKVLTGLVITGIATAGFGSVTTFVTLFYYILR